MGVFSYADPKKHYALTPHIQNIYFVYVTVLFYHAVPSLSSIKNRAAQVILRGSLSLFINDYPQKLLSP